jgi:sulfur relay (sulfurtransferase) DsrF/TusC family protein
MTDEKQKYPFTETPSDMGVKLVKGGKTKKVKMTYRDIPDSGVEHEKIMEISDEKKLSERMHWTVKDVLEYLNRHGCQASVEVIEALEAELQKTREKIDVDINFLKQENIDLLNKWQSAEAKTKQYQEAFKKQALYGHELETLLVNKGNRLAKALAWIQEYIDYGYPSYEWDNTNLETIRKILEGKALGGAEGEEGKS